MEVEGKGRQLELVPCVRFSLFYFASLGGENKKNQNKKECLNKNVSLSFFSLTGLVSLAHVASVGSMLLNYSI